MLVFRIETFSLWVRGPAQLKRYWPPADLQPVGEPARAARNPDQGRPALFSWPAGCPPPPGPPPSASPGSGAPVVCLCASECLRPCLHVRVRVCVRVRARARVRV